MAEHPQAQEYAGVRAKLVRGMLRLQQPTGMFVTAFPPAIDIDAQNYFPGEALLALAAHYEHQPSADILDAFDRALRFYRDYFRQMPSPAFVPWQVQAYAKMARVTRRKDYADYVFELTDWLVDKQLDHVNCPWSMMWGGIATRDDGRATASTALHLEALAEALTLARSVDDRARIDRYERALRGAARFVMQLQVRPEEAYYIRSPQDAIGGIRTSPALHLLRIDHTQHGLTGLIKTKAALFPETR